LVLLQKKDRSRPVPTNFNFYFPKALPLRDVAIGLGYYGLSAQRSAKNIGNKSPVINYEVFCLKSSG